MGASLQSGPGPSGAPHPMWHKSPNKSGLFWNTVGSGEMVGLGSSCPENDVELAAASQVTHHMVTLSTCVAVQSSDAKVRPLEGFGFDAGYSALAQCQDVVDPWRCYQFVPSGTCILCECQLHVHVVACTCVYLCARVPPHACAHIKCARVWRQGSYDLWALSKHNTVSTASLTASCWFTHITAPALAGGPLSPDSGPEGRLGQMHHCYLPLGPQPKASAQGFPKNTCPVVWCMWGSSFQALPEVSSYNQNCLWFPWTYQI